MQSLLAPDSFLEGYSVSRVVIPTLVPGVGSKDRHLPRIGGVGVGNFRVLRLTPVEQDVGDVGGHVGIFHGKVEDGILGVTSGVVLAFLPQPDGTLRGRDDGGPQRKEEEQRGGGVDRSRQRACGVCVREECLHWCSGGSLRSDGTDVAGNAESDRLN